MKQGCTERLECILGVAEKLQDPAKVCALMPGLHTLSLSEGYPGLLVFFSALEQTGLVKEGISHHYALKIKETLETEGIPEASLFTGLAGICFAIEQASCNGVRYSRLLKTLHTHLIKKVRDTHLRFMKELLQKNQIIPSFFYDVIQGICGIGRYLLQSSSGIELAAEITKTLVLLNRPLVIEGYSVPGWYLSHEDPLNSRWSKDQRGYGNFNLGLAHGISGVLAFLSIAWLRGVIVDEQKETMRAIASWICNKSIEKRWPYVISWEEEVGLHQPDQSPSRDAWCYGVPGIARSLFLAGKALEDEELKAFAAAAFRDVFTRHRTDWDLPGPMLCHGISGLMMIALGMSQEAGHEDCASHLYQLEQELLGVYKQDTPFGFDDLIIQPNGTYASSKNPGLLEGAAGVALSLFSISNPKLPWHLPLFIHE